MGERVEIFMGVVYREVSQEGDVEDLNFQFERNSEAREQFRKHFGKIVKIGEHF